MLQRLKYLLVLAACSCACRLHAQPPEQDCLGGIIVCQPTYVQNNSYSGVGQNDELNFPGNTSCLSSGEQNSVWYLFTVNVGGVLDFQIVPNVLSDDYDWAVYNISAGGCNGIGTGTSPEVRCNYSAITGSTGCSAGALLTSVGAGGPNQCLPMNVVTGEVYALIINNQAGSTTGYTLNFTGTAIIYDTIPPMAIKIDPFPCNPPDSIVVTFNENVRCGSIAADGSDFYVTGPAPVTVVSATGATCGAGQYATVITLVLSSPMNVNGTYTLHFQTGTDGDVLQDFCGNQTHTTDSLNFVLALIDAQFSFNLVNNCFADSVFFTDLSTGDTVNVWNWDFDDGFTSALQNPVHGFSSTGSYWVTLAVTDTGGCFDEDSLLITTYVEPPVAAFTYSPLQPCAQEPITFTNNSTGQGIFYLWDMGNGFTTAQQDPIYAFPVGGTFTVWLYVTDSIGCVDSISQQITVAPALDAAFYYSPAILCNGQPIQLTDSSLGNPASWLWDFGNGFSDSTQDPIITYADSGLYFVTLIVDNGLCLPDTQIVGLDVGIVPIVDLGIDTMICIGESMVLNSGYPNLSVTWSTGETTPTITVTNVPVLVWVEVNDNGCKTRDSIYIDTECELAIPNAFTPNGDGLNDVFQVVQKSITNFNMKVFSRWGEMLFESSSPDVGWDGTHKGAPEEIGTYVYLVRVIFTNGKSLVQTGNVTLLR